MKDWDTGFSGSFFSNSEMLDELVVILFISLLLMYFILAAQFESFCSLCLFWRRYRLTSHLHCFYSGFADIR